MKKNWGKKNNTELHISVLLDELVNSIRIFKKKNIIVDCTLGMWWHAREIIKKLNKWDTFIWFDADKRNLEIAQPKLQEEFKDSWIELIFINDNFSNLGAISINAKSIINIATISLTGVILKI